MTKPEKKWKKEITGMNTDFIKWLSATLICIAPACTSGNDSQSPKNGKLHFEVSARAPLTKTTIVGTEKPGEPGKFVYTPMWGADDHVAVLFGANADSAPAEELANSLGAGETALFTGDISAPATGTASVVYPYSAWTGGKSGYATLKSSQAPALTSFDPSCDILCAEPKAYSESSGTVNISGLLFHRLTGVLRIELTGPFAAGNHIQSIKFTAPEGTKLAGNFTVDFDGADIASIPSGTNVVSATYAEGPVIGSGSVFLSLLPCVIAKSGKITVEARTESYDIVKTITLNEALTIPKGGVAVLRLSVTDVHCTSLLDREGWTTTQVQTGLKWHNFEGMDPVTSKQQIVNVLEADLDNSGLQFSFVYSDINKKVSEIAAEKKAVAAVNATYGADQPGVVYIKTNGTVRRGIDFNVDGYTAWKHKAAVWYDGISSFGFYNYHAFNKETSNNAYIADTHPNLFSSAPLLIDNGNHTELSYFSDGTNVAQIHPRTVLAVTRSGRLLLITIDGRLSTAKGMTCAEMQEFLDRYFAPLYAINMDGGGSTTMYIAGNGVVNYPCHGTLENGEDVSRDHSAERDLPSFFVLNCAVGTGIDPITVDDNNDEWYQIR
ncbi:MAG: phosphodiester glycosidase family protein [Bacteroidales bacterium]|nr:phosphodiester glycosidase family protein [Bacteroidales bacterium]